MQFQIPRQNDQSIIAAFGKIRDGLENPENYLIKVHPPNGGEINISDKEPEKAESISYIVCENSESVESFSLYDQRASYAVLTVRRPSNKITDDANLDWNHQWLQHIPAEQRGRISVKLAGLARKHLRAFDVEASLSGGGDTEWARYRDSQQAILNSLQETQKTLIEDFSRRAIEAENAAKTRHATLEEELRLKNKALDEQLGEEHGKKLKFLEDREIALKAREESFNTKEARYVARKVQQEQIDDIKTWLNGWSLTKGTRDKRLAVTLAYVAGIAVNGFMVVWFSVQNVDILKGNVLSEVTWWQWTLLSLKVITPLAAFISFVVYFIRWTSAWARQHSEEEFRNRARVLDIGRARWLLEAVRDAQDNQKELPPELLKELSRNLFDHGVYSKKSDTHPQAVNDLILQGLASIRVKSPDGSEVEATRTNSKKDKN